MGRPKAWAPLDGAEPGTLTLDRWSGERHNWHRALLLYAMQHEGKAISNISRSRAAVGRAMGVSVVSVSTWAIRWRWLDRINNVQDAEGVAVAMYRTLYMEMHGKNELPHVMNNIIVPMTVTARANDLRVESTADDIIQKAKLKAESAVRAEEAVMATITERRKKEREKVEQYRGLLDATIGESARLLKERRLKMTAKDIPVLIAARQELTQWLAQQDDRHLENHGGVESARLKHARDTGKDLVEAMWQDLEEMRTILSTMRTSRDAANEELQPTNFAALNQKEAPSTTKPEAQSDG